jgi:hypothetical protein
MIAVLRLLRGTDTRVMHLNDIYSCVYLDLVAFISLLSCNFCVSMCFNEAMRMI